uniref:Deoxynucleotide monophosphate kinase n=1 Tax=Iridovirus LCIVAC01 TaxID=2506607 RepID=A0A481YS57_9VIRU|nr:MAG: deoxynucleotide monophosphate kinase [Iridovirus LCIVAC01]
MKSIPRLFLIIGGKRSGKDTVANYLAKSLSGTRLSIAYPLKKLVCDQFKIDMLKLEALKENESKIVAEGRSMRQILQNTGQSLKKVFGDEDIHCKCIEKQFSDSKVVIITDVRLKHEHDYFVSRYCDVTRIKIGTNKNQKDSHRTEQEWNEIEHDVFIYNEFIGINYLLEKVRRLVLDKINF